MGAGVCAGILGPGCGKGVAEGLGVGASRSLPRICAANSFIAFVFLILASESIPCKEGNFDGLLGFCEFLFDSKFKPNAPLLRIALELTALLIASAFCAL